MENKNIELHNNDRVEEVDQVDINNKTKSINRQCGTCNIKFKSWKYFQQNNSINWALFAQIFKLNLIMIGYPTFYSRVEYDIFSANNV